MSKAAKLGDSEIDSDQESGVLVGFMRKPDCAMCPILMKQISDYKDLVSKSEVMKKEIADLKTALNKKEGDVEDLLAKLQETEMQLRDTTNKLETAKLEISHLKSDIKYLQENHHKSTSEMTKVMRRLSKLESETLRIPTIEEELQKGKKKIKQQEAKFKEMQTLVNIDCLLIGQIPFTFFEILSGYLFSENEDLRKQCRKSVTYSEFVNYAKQSPEWERRWKPILAEWGTDEDLEQWVKTLKDLRKPYAHPKLRTMSKEKLLQSMLRVIDRKDKSGRLITESCIEEFFT